MLSSTFFKQGGWMIFATLAGGLGNTLVQVATQNQLSGGEVGIFAALLGALGQVTIPVIGVSTVFAHQTVLAGTANRPGEVAAAVRGVLGGVVLLWVILVILTLLFEQRILINLKITRPAAVWVALVVALTSLISPVLTGVVQGRQNFLWLGWSAIFNGFGRLIGVVYCLWWVSRDATGAMIGVLLGSVAALTILAWQTRDVWRTKAEKFPWRVWSMRLLPLTLGLGAYTYLFTQDMIAAQRAFPEQSDGYAVARLVGAMLVFLSAPLTSVMFPKIVQSLAKAERTNVLFQALGATALVAGVGALGCTILPTLPLRVMSGGKYLYAAPLVPWFAWCMLPLALANVLISNLLAREYYSAVPWLVALAVIYGTVLHFYHPSLLAIIQFVGIFSLLLLAIALWFSWQASRKQLTRAGGQGAGPIL